MIPWKEGGSTVIHYAHEAPYKAEGEGRLYSGIDVTKERTNELNLKKVKYIILALFLER